MKFCFFKITALAGLICFAGCSKDDDTPPASTNFLELKVDGEKEIFEEKAFEVAGISLFEEVGGNVTTIMIIASKPMTLFSLPKRVDVAISNDQGIQTGTWYSNQIGQNVVVPNNLFSFTYVDADGELNNASLPGSAITSFSGDVTFFIKFNEISSTRVKGEFYGDLALETDFTNPGAFVKREVTEGFFDLAR